MAEKMCEPLIATVALLLRERWWRMEIVKRVSQEWRLA